MTAAPIVLVPGFWLGAWAWDEVAETLRADGHEVTALTLPGLESVEEMLALEDPISPAFVREFVSGTIHDPVPEEFLSTVVSQSLKVPARVWRDYLEGVVLTVDDTARLGEIGAPTLILWGEQDTLLPRREQEWRAAAIPNATLRVYPETGHLAHWVRPEWVVRDLEAFMRESRPV